jgi:hypothetical protein
MDAPIVPQEIDVTDGRELMASSSPGSNDGNTLQSSSPGSNGDGNTLQSSHSEEKLEDYIIPYDPDEYGFRRIIRNFTPSYV